MTCILFTDPSVATLKARLRDVFSEIPDVKSSHLSEAIARALGFNTHAALLAAVRDPNRFPTPADDYRLLNLDEFRLRLKELSGVNDDLGISEIDDYLGAIPTDPGDLVEYKTERELAWRNVMVAGINAGLGAGLFTIRPGDNRWPSGADRERASSAHVRFEIAGLPSLAWFSSAGFGELNVGVAVNPTADTIRLGGGGDGFDFGDAVAHGWLERERGAWMQTSTTRFSCRRSLQSKLAELVVRPRCFGDRGSVIM